MLKDPGRLPVALSRTDGSVLDAYVSVVAFADGADTRHAMILTDVTDLLDARRRQDTAERENRAKDEFLAMLGHELRNPLAAIAGAAAVLNSASDHDISTRAREIVVRQVAQLARLVDDLLDVGRVVTGKIPAESGPRRPRGGSQQPRACARRTPWRRGTRQGDVRPGVGERRSAAPRADCRQPARERVRSSRHPPGRCDVDVREHDGRATIEVRDTGAGIDPALLPHVFDLFVQGRTTLDRGNSGLGIGLTLVRRLAELHHGTITAHSEGEGRGATFVVQLPAIAAPALAATPVSHEPSARLRVLVIEDNDDARDALVMMLQLTGHEVFGAREGHAGLALFRECRPEVTLIDIGLPDMDGYEIARRIRLESTGHLPHLIALSGYGSPADRERALAAGFDRHLTKPASAGDLARALLLTGRPAPQERSPT